MRYAGSVPAHGRLAIPHQYQCYLPDGLWATPATATTPVNGACEDVFCTVNDQCNARMHRWCQCYLCPPLMCSYDPVETCDAAPATAITCPKSVLVTTVIYVRLMIDATTACVLWRSKICIAASPQCYDPLGAAMLIASVITSPFPAHVTT